MADIKKLAEEIVGLTLLEAVELKKVLKEDYGIEAATGGAVMMAGSEVQEQARRIANQVEMMKANPNFQKQAKLIAKKMEKMADNSADRSQG